MLDPAPTGMTQENEAYKYTHWYTYLILTTKLEEKYYKLYSTNIKKLSLNSIQLQFSAGQITILSEPTE